MGRGFSLASLPTPRPNQNGRDRSHEADELLALSTVLICPTSQTTPPASFHPEVTVDGIATRV